VGEIVESTDVRSLAKFKPREDSQEPVNAQSPSPIPPRGWREKERPFKNGRNSKRCVFPRMYQILQGV